MAISELVPTAVRLTENGAVPVDPGSRERLVHERVGAPVGVSVGVFVGVSVTFVSLSLVIVIVLEQVVASLSFS